MTAIKNCKIAGWQNVNELVHSLYFIELFKENFSETICYIGLIFSEIIEILMLFQYSDILFYHSSDNDKHMQIGQTSKQGFAYC